MRPAWKGALSAGSLNIPVKMYAATTPRKLNFSILHKSCFSRIKYDKHCPLHGHVLPDEMISAYEYEENKYIAVDESDFDKIQLDSKHTITLSQFVDFDQIDPIYYHRPYYLVPDGPIAGETYALLRNAMKRKRKLALAQIVLQRKEYIAALWPKNRMIVLSTLYYENEIRGLSDFEELRIKAPRSRVQQRSTEKIIDDLSAKFKPRLFKDHFRVQLMAIIKKKIDSHKSVTRFQIEAEVGEQLQYQVSEKNLESGIGDVIQEKKGMAKSTLSREKRNVSSA